jgi:charged multivesicular body protein 1
MSCRYTPWLHTPSPCTLLPCSKSPQSTAPPADHPQFQAKHARREAQKALKADQQLEDQIVQLLKAGETDKAYRKTRMLLHKRAIAQQLDNLADMAEISAEQVKANNTMTRMTGMMAQSTRTMAAAQSIMTPERTLQALEQYKSQNDEYAMSSGIFQDAMTESTSTTVSDDAAQDLMARLADAAGVQLDRELSEAVPSSEEPVGKTTTAEPSAEEEDALQQRLRALRA